MGYEDFYNLITELGNLSSLTNEAIPLGENIEVNSENVASLIEEASRHLTVTSDGSLKIDLSGLGIDFKTSADGLSKNVDAGIKEFANS
jgi:hypothetical protein